MSLKIIFDTNAIQRDHIREMLAANIITAAESGRISIYLTPTLISERMHFLIDSPDKWHTQAVEDAKFLLSVPWKRMFREPAGPEGIYAKELEGYLLSEYLFFDGRAVLAGLHGELNGRDPLSSEQRNFIREEKELWKKKKILNHEQYKLMRQDIEKAAAARGEDRSKLDFEIFLESQFEKEAIKKIENSINSKLPKEKLVNYWKTSRQRCPYYNKFIEGVLFIAWYSMATNSAIDMNAYEDVEHLIYLNGVDAMVGHEKGFMFEAAKALFPEKKYMSVKEFIGILKS